MTTRFLLSCISAFYYDGENTLDDLHQAIADEAVKLYSEGIQVSLSNLITFLYFFDFRITEFDVARNVLHGQGLLIL